MSDSPDCSTLSKDAQFQFFKPYLERFPSGSVERRAFLQEFLCIINPRMLNKELKAAIKVDLLAKKALTESTLNTYSSVLAKHPREACNSNQVIAWEDTRDTRLTIAQQSIHSWH